MDGTRLVEIAEVVGLIGGWHSKQYTHRQTALYQGSAGYNRPVICLGPILLKGVVRRVAHLYICNRSRVIALRHYHLHFGNRLMHPIYMNPELDTVFVQDIGILNSFMRADKTYYPISTKTTPYVKRDLSIQTLALNPTTQLKGNTLYNVPNAAAALVLKKALHCFPNVQELVLFLIADDYGLYIHYAIQLWILGRALLNMRRILGCSHPAALPKFTQLLHTRAGIGNVSRVQFLRDSRKNLVERNYYGHFARQGDLDLDNMPTLYL